MYPITPDSRSQFFFRSMLYLLPIVLISAVVGTLLLAALERFWGIENAQLAAESLSAESSPADRNVVRWLLTVSHIFIFLLPSLLFAFVLYRRQGATFLKFNRLPTVANLALGGLLVLTALPLALFLYWLNQQIPFPEGIVAMEERAGEMTKNLLMMTNSQEFMFNLVVIALIPAIGEELMFRGVVQQILERLVANEHLAVWGGALIFSAIHLQFQGFFPRMLLGGLLGYTFLWSKNLWIPIFAHFLNNGSQIVVQYFSKMDIEQSDLAIDKIGGSAAISLLFVLFFAYQMNRWNNSKGTHQ